MPMRALITGCRQDLEVNAVSRYGPEHDAHQALSLSGVGQTDDNDGCSGGGDDDHHHHNNVAAAAENCSDGKG